MWAAQSRAATVVRDPLAALTTGGVKGGTAIADDDGMDGGVYGRAHGAGAGVHTDREDGLGAAATEGYAKDDPVRRLVGA